ncbi:MAG TPA: PfkB family carbohydrate kinase [Blastocatellia bacterium]|nr:PfkB family carbohydrate kinase [Blastocatellia bacterium]
MRITILEFTPCADSIFHVRRDAEEGYVASDGREVRIQAGAKLRPQLITTYAGGKATNVARVMDKLLGDTDAVDVELIVFRPDSPEGRYLDDLQRSALSRVRVRPVIIEGRARFCIDLTDPTTAESNRVEFNISPRAVWAESALAVALEQASQISSDVLLIAGNPPLIETTGAMAVDLYAQVIAAVRRRVRVISLDTEKALVNCLKAEARPDLIKINEAEYASIAPTWWDDFNGALIVTDARGCRLWPERARDQSVRMDGAQSRAQYSTIGAGDAMHAGFAIGRWVRGYDLAAAARYGQAAAAAAVNSPDGTRGVNAATVERFFAELEDRSPF